MPVLRSTRCNTYIKVSVYILPNLGTQMMSLMHVVQKALTLGGLSAISCIFLALRHRVRPNVWSFSTYLSYVSQAITT